MWAVDIAPTSNRDVDGSVVVSVGRVSTVDAQETVLCLTITLCSVTAARALLRSIARVNLLERNTVQSCFVRQERLQFMECPAMEIGSLLAPKLHTITDTCQFLDGNPAAGAFRKVYDLFADAVVLIFGVALFLLGKIAQYTLCRLRSFALQTATLAATTLAHTEHGSAIVTVAVTIKGEVTMPESTPSHSSGSNPSGSGMSQV